jgi:hypothetical protein
MELYQRITLSELQRLYPTFDWMMFIQEIYKDVPNSSGNFPADAEVVIYGIDYIGRLEQLLQQHHKRYLVVQALLLIFVTSRTKHNYLVWCWFFKVFMRDLPDPYASSLFNFFKKLNSTLS